MLAIVAVFITGEVQLPWKEGIHELGGRSTVKVSLATGHEATARVRWNRVHEQVEALVQMGQVLAAEKEQRGRERTAVQRLAAEVMPRSRRKRGTTSWPSTTGPGSTRPSPRP